MAAIEEVRCNELKSDRYSRLLFLSPVGDWLLARGSLVLLDGSCVGEISISVGRL